MYDVNDDMEDLFRRAAENYPLKAGGMDWNRVERPLSTSEDQEVLNRRSDKNNSKKSWLLLLLVMPVMWICNNYLSKQKNSGGRTEVGAVDERAVVETGNSTNGTMEITAGRDALSLKNNQGLKLKVSPGNKSKGNNLLNRNIEKNSFFKSEQRLIERTTSNQTLRSKQLISDEITLSSDQSTINNVGKSAISIKDSTKNSSETKTIFDTSNKAFGEIENNNNTGEKPKELLRQRFYYGAMVTLDVSTVKSQPTKIPGTGLGLIVGYNISQKLRVESGVSLQKKLYFSDAKYYNPKTPYNSPGYKLIDVDGECNMWEVPLNLRYIFSSSAKQNWFTTVGSSSYFMKAENYTYNFERYGQPGSMNMSYNNGSKTLFAVLNLSMGYEKKFGKLSTLRIESYFKAPVKGIGWGKLPITSSGLNIGYTKGIF
jgi:hypothetical protein